MQKLEKDFIDSIVARYGEGISKLNLANNGLSDIENIILLSASLVKLNLSKNNLENIASLSSLSNLNELDISQNKIQDITPLTSLVKLDYLNISGNRISQLSQLQPLKYLNKLRVLKLQGNPVCLNSIDYPIEVFRLQDSLEVVDEWERDQVMVETQIPPTNASLKLPLPPTTSSQDYNTVSSRKVQSLQLQVQSLHDAFQSQEELLALKTRQSLTTPQYTHMFQRYAVSQQKLKEKVGPIVPQLPPEKHSELLQTFPYYRLLAAWRQKVLQSMIQQSVLQSSYQTLMNTHQQERQSFQQQKQESELLCLKYTQTIQAYQLQVQQLTNDLQASQQSYEGLQLSTNQLYTKYVFYYKEYMKQAQYFVQLHEQLKQEGQFFLPMTPNTPSSHIGFHPATLPSTANAQVFTVLLQKLTKYEQKLCLLQGQIEKLSILLQQKEIYYRNSVANQELLKRLQLLRYQKQLLIDTSTTSDDHAHVHVQQKKGVDKHNHKQQQQQKEQKEHLINQYFSEIVINAEMEGILKTIFMNLDMEQEGLVPIALLLQVFLNTVPTPFPLHEQSMDEDDNADEEDEEEEGDDTENENKRYAKRRKQQRSARQQQEQEKEKKEFTDYWQYWQSYAMTSNPETAKVFFHWFEAQFTPIGQVLSQSLGRKRCFILLYNLLSTYFEDDLSGKSKKNTKISWGEFVVHCIPMTLLQDPIERLSPSFPSIHQQNRYRGRSTLRTSEYLALQHLQLIDNTPISFQYSSLPLVLPNHPSSSTSATHSSATATTATLSYDALLQANQRLQEERQYLLSTLQQQSKQQIRIAEEIKYYFDHEINLLTKQTITLRHQLDEQSDAYQQAQQRILDMNTQHATQLTHMEEQLRTIQGEYAQVIRQQEGKKEEVLTSYETQVQEHQQRYTRLELEYTVLQRENNKKEVKNKTLVRDLLRLESTVAQLTEAMNTQKQVIQQQQVEHSQSVTSVMTLKDAQREQYEQVQQVVKGQEQEIARLQAYVETMRQELLETKEALREANIATAVAATATSAASVNNITNTVPVDTTTTHSHSSSSKGGSERIERGRSDFVGEEEDHAATAAAHAEEEVAYDHIRDEIRYIRSLHPPSTTTTAATTSTLPRSLSHANILPTTHSSHHPPHHHQPSYVSTSGLKNEKLDQHLGRLLQYVEHLIDDKA